MQFSQNVYKKVEIKIKLLIIIGILKIGWGSLQNSQDQDYPVTFIICTVHNKHLKISYFNLNSTPTLLFLQSHSKDIFYLKMSLSHIINYYVILIIVI